MTKKRIHHISLTRLEYIEHIAYLVYKIVPVRCLDDLDELDKNISDICYCKRNWPTRSSSDLIWKKN